MYIHIYIYMHCYIYYASLAGFMKFEDSVYFLSPLCSYI